MRNLVHHPTYLRYDSVIAVTVAFSKYCSNLFFKPWICIIVYVVSILYRHRISVSCLDIVILENVVRFAAILIFLCSGEIWQRCWHKSEWGARRRRGRFWSKFGRRTDESLVDWVSAISVLVVVVDLLFFCFGNRLCSLSVVGAVTLSPVVLGFAWRVGMIVPNVFAKSVGQSLSKKAQIVWIESYVVLRGLNIFYANSYSAYWVNILINLLIVINKYMNRNETELKIYHDSLNSCCYVLSVFTEPDIRQILYLFSLYFLPYLINLYIFLL